MKCWVLIAEQNDYDCIPRVEGVFESADDARAEYPDVEWTWSERYRQWDAKTGTTRHDYYFTVEEFDFHPAKVKA
jgi:hypothetical protein